MPSTVAEHFANFAPSYDRVNHILSLGLDVGWRARLIGGIDARPSLEILDLCAGTLACARGALERFPDSRVVAADFSRPMLDFGLSRLPKPLRDRVNIICADAGELDFGSGSFDVVICSWGMRHLPEQVAMLDKIRLWLKPGGQFVILDFFKPSATLSKIFHATVGRYLLPAEAQLLKGFGEAYRYLYDSIERFMTRTEYERLLAARGFSIRCAEELTFGIVSVVECEVVKSD